METRTHVPQFTVSLRGYDRMEVDEYLESMADAVGHVDQTEDQNRRLQAHINRLNSRIKELEDRIEADTPKTGAILAERIGILLRSAEDAASDTMVRAEARAAEMISDAREKVAEAEEEARASVARGEDQARRIEAAARGEAAEIVSEAEARAVARTHQIEQWADQVVSHTRAEEARMLKEHQERRKAAAAELRSLAEQRDAAASILTELRETLGQALGLVGPPRHPVALTEAAAFAQPEVTSASLGSPVDHVEHVEAAGTTLPAPDEDGPQEQAPSLYDGDEDSSTGELDPPSIELRDATGADTESQAEADEFEAKFEAWVSEGHLDQN